MSRVLDFARGLNSNPRVTRVAARGWAPPFDDLNLTKRVELDQQPGDLARERLQEQGRGSEVLYPDRLLQ